MGTKLSSIKYNKNFPLPLWEGLGEGNKKAFTQPTPLPNPPHKGGGKYEVDCFKNKKILITCGPTWVPIDDVRVISNKSTGELGQRLARECAKKGAKVIVLEGPVKEALKEPAIRVIKFQFFDELKSLLNKELKNKYDVVIHAAAVSDYQLKKPFKSKLKSDRSFKLALVPTPKLIDEIRKRNPNVFLVGFKLEFQLNLNSVKRASRDLFKKAKCDLVVANINKNQRYQGYILDQEKIIAKGDSRQAIVLALIQALTYHL